jgi:hypothetical protein
MAAKDWLQEHGIDPDSVSDSLMLLLNACEDQKIAEMLRISLIATAAEAAAIRGFLDRHAADRLE